MRAFVAFIASISIATLGQSAFADDQLQLITDEADAALAILSVERAHQPVPPALWQRLFQSEGYQLLKQREASMKRPFTDDDFRRFLGDQETLAAAPALTRTLDDWKHRSLAGAQTLAHAYLPAQTTIHAGVLLLIKPWKNSFVFKANGVPHIFLYLDPTKSSPQFENTVAHELHHIGLEAACAKPNEASLSPSVKLAREFVGGFGEGLAMLAAAGGPDVHPHALSPPEDRARWDRDLARFDDDLRAVERFFLDILDGKIKDEQQAFDVARPFWGIQGAWYTVGWKMAVTVEKRFGRARLVHDECDPVALLGDYNRAATTGARWSESLLRRLAAR